MSIAFTPVGSNYVVTASGPGAESQLLFTLDLSSNELVVTSPVFPAETCAYIRKQLIAFGTAANANPGVTLPAIMQGLIAIQALDGVIPTFTIVNPPMTSIITVTIDFSAAGITVLQFAASITNGFDATPIAAAGVPASAAPNTVFAGPDGGSAAAPTFRTIVLPDLPPILTVTSSDTAAGPTYEVSFGGPSGREPSSFAALSLDVANGATVTLQETNVDTLQSVNVAVYLTQTGAGAPGTIEFDPAWKWLGAKPAGAPPQQSITTGDELLLVLTNVLDPAVPGAYKIIASLQALT